VHNIQLQAVCGNTEEDPVCMLHEQSWTMQLCLNNQNRYKCHKIQYNITVRNQAQRSSKWMYNRMKNFVLIINYIGCGVIKLCILMLFSSNEIFYNIHASGEQRFR